MKVILLQDVKNVEEDDIVEVNGIRKKCACCARDSVWKRAKKRSMI